MTAGAFNISMVLRADVANAKAAMSDVAGSMRGLASEAGKAGAATRKEAEDLALLATAAAKAAMSQEDLAAAERRAFDARQRAAAGPVNVLAQPANSSIATWRAAETSAEGLRKAVSGLNTSLEESMYDMMGSTVEARIYRQSLDEIRAAFNPLFAASRQYEEQLDRISQAEKLGAISAREAATARERAVSMIAPIGSASGRGGGVQSWQAAGLAAQFNDIGVMMAAGQNPMQLALQQGTQISQVLTQVGGGTAALRALGAGFMGLINPISLATIGIIGFGAAGVQWLTSLAPEVKTLDDALSGLESSVDTYAKSQDRARMSAKALRAEFGSMSEIARKLLDDMSELDRRAANRDIAASLAALPREFGIQMDDYAVPGSSDIKSLFDVSGWDREGMGRVFGIESAMRWANDAKGIEQQTRAVETLRERWIAAAEASGGMTEEQEGGLRVINTMLDRLATMQAIDENAAGKAEAADMARDLERRAELERTILAYGEQSAAVRGVENRQEREALLLRLDELKVARDSAEAQKVLGALSDLQAARETSARDARAGWLREQDDRIAGLRLEVSLIGASAAEQGRAKALAEAELEIRDKKLGILEATLARVKAIAAAEAEHQLERARSLEQLRVDTVTDGYDARIGLARDPVSKADLEFLRDYARAVGNNEDADFAWADANRVRTRSINEAIGAAAVQAASIAEEVQIRQRIAEQVAAGTVQASEANRLIREELELRPLVAAAARAEGDEKARLLEVIDALRQSQEAMAAEERRQGQNDYLQGQAERIQQARLELALAGETAAVRARILALVQAEQDIRRLGMSGEAAEEARRNARLEAELAQSIEAQANAWKQVQSAGEAAIDSVLDKLKKGDIRGALADFIGEIEKGFFDLAIRNPLKNAIFGTNLGTLDDIGGLQGIWDRLSGRSRADEQALVSMGAAPVQSMIVTAANVILNGNVLSGMGAGAANLNGMPGGLAGSADVQSQVWSFFAAKGLAPHQIAGIMGNASAESAFNPLAIGDGGTSFGLFQHHASRGQNLLSSVGGMSGLGDIQGQLAFVWKELMTSEVAAMRRLMASTDVRGATEAFVGFERPAGYTAQNPSGALHFDRRLAAAEQALINFGSSAQTASLQLDQGAEAAAGGMKTLGDGMGQFGGSLGQLLAGLAGSVGGKAGGLLSTLLSIGSDLSNGVPLFDVGGFTGGSDPSRAAGIVHEGEYVFSAPAVRKIGLANLEGIHRGTMRGFRDGGLVSRMPVMQTAANGAAAPGGGTGREELHMHFDLTGARGNREIEELVERSISTAFDIYDRRALPARVRQIVPDSRRVG